MKSVYQWKIYSRILSSSPVTSKWCEVSIPIYGRERGFGLHRVKPRFNSSHKGSESAQEVRSLTYNRFNNNNPTQTHHPPRSKINPISNLENPGLVGQLATSSTYQLVRHIWWEILYSFIQFWWFATDLYQYKVFFEFSSLIPACSDRFAFFWCWYTFVLAS